MVDWDKELEEAKFRLLQKVYLAAMKKIEEKFKEGVKKQWR